MRVFNVFAVFPLLMVMSAASLAAQDEESLTRSGRVFEDIPTVADAAGVEGEKERPPDYSREALLSAVWSDPYYDEEVPRAPKTFNPFEFTVFGQTFRFMPFLGAVGSSGTSATPFNYVDPFAIAPTSAAYTPKTFRDRWWEWKMKRKLDAGKYED